MVKHTLTDLCIVADLGHAQQEFEKNIGVMDAFHNHTNEGIRVTNILEA